MEQQQNPLESAFRLQNLLRTAGIESMVIGGIAVAIWGEPRLTRDADLKILLQRDQAAQLIAAFPSEYRCLSSEPVETLQRLGFIFVQDSSGVRLDLLLAETEFDVDAMKRRKEMEALPGMRLSVCSAEDLIIYKLISTRARDHEDAGGVVRRQGDQLNHQYVEHWLSQFEKALDDSTLVARYRKMRQV